MDHLPRPPDCSVRPLQVPLVADFTYDFAGFETFPQRKGFIKDGHLDTTRSSTELASLIQSWLYFGLVAIVLGHPINHNDFARTESPDRSGTTFLCSSKLPALFDAWQNRLRGLGVELCDKELRSMTETLTIAIEGSELFDKVETYDSSPYAAVALSVKLLIITLIHVHNGINQQARFPVYHESLLPAAAQRHGGIPAAAEMLMARMTETGWCRRAIWRACMSYDYLTVFYLSQLKRQRNSGHDDCTAEVCLGYNVTESHYITKHVTANCHCQYASVNVEKVKSIIEKGGVPLIQVKGGGTPDIRLAVTQSVAPTYYAISHVWADGLGNPNANSLPTCQLRYISQKLPLESLLWIDTLCIPVGDENKTLRRKAIDSMASIYHDAQAVIVLDAEIQQRCKGGRRTNIFRNPRTALERRPEIAVVCELRAHILCSAWNSRCWTYQEAIMGRYLAVDTTDHLSSPISLAFYPTPISSTKWTHEAGLQWTNWRNRSHPRQRVLRYAGTLIAATPLSDSFLLGFKLFCGAQAWERCRKAVTIGSRNHEPFDQFGWLGGGIWLVVAALGGLLTLPCFAILALYIWLFFGIAGPLILAVEFAMTGCGTLSTQETLELEFALQLAGYVSAELRPTRITKATELRQPEAASRLRVRELAETWNAVTWRSTTKIDDIHSILANLTDATAFDITALPIAQRMRAIASNYEHLPIDLLFDSSVLRDSENPWLPLAPGSDLIASASTPRTMKATSEEVRADFAELNGLVMAFACTESKPVASPTELWDPIRETVFTPKNRTPDHGSRQYGRVVYLIEMPNPRLNAGLPTSLRGARLMVREQKGNEISCEYDGPVVVTTSREEFKTPTETSATMLSNNTVLRLPFRHRTQDRTRYRRPISVYENWLLLAIMLTIYVIGGCTVLIVLGSKTDWSAVYIGYPIWVGIVSGLSAIGTLNFRRLDRSRFDERLTGFADRRLARGINKWLLYLTINFAHEQGSPKRWYHYLVDVPFAHPRQRLVYNQEFESEAVRV